MRRLVEVLVLVLLVVAFPVPDALRADESDVGIDEWNIWEGTGTVDQVAVSLDLVVFTDLDSNDVHVWAPDNPDDPRNAVLHLTISRSADFRSLALHGNRIVLGESPYDRVHVVDWNGQSWDDTIIDEPYSIEGFGVSVAVQGEVLVVGAPGSWEECCHIQPGRVFVYEREKDGSWVGTELPRPPVKGDYDAFGQAVALDGNRIVVGNPDDPAPDGSIVIYESTGQDWEWTRIVAPPEATNEIGAGTFGSSVDIDGDTIVVGAYHSSTAFVYRAEGDTWTGRQLLRPGTRVDDYFGWDVAVDFDVIAVTAPNGYPGPSEIHVFDATSGAHLETLAGFEQEPAQDYWMGETVTVDRTVLAYTARYGSWDEQRSRVYLHRLDYGRFLDDQNQFESDIEWLAKEGITKGCNPPLNDLFCPARFVTRGQMAAFLVRALAYTDNSGGDLFIDDDGNTFEADIDKLATAGVTKGCNPPTNDRYCPHDFVTRGQMAAFLVRALGYADNGEGDLFIDDDGNIFENDIDKLGTAGITRGCNPPANTEYCPNDFVTREQVAAFLHRALGG